MDTLREYVLVLVEAVGAQPALYALALMLALALVNIWLLSRRVTRLTKGGDGATLEGTIRALGERAEILETYAKKTEHALENLDGRLATSVRGVAVERFDPFEEQGGRQSFVTSFLNEAGDGVVVSSIHSRDSVRVYAKDIKHFKSERELSAEERRAVENAKKKLA